MSEEEAVSRFQRYGPNELPEKKRITPVRIFLRQFNDFMIWVLLAAVLISGLILGEHIDALAILGIVILNAALGFVQEYRAEIAMAALKDLAAPTARVIRSGTERVIKAKELVPGDLIILEAGDYVPADARLVQAVNLMANEAALTGESGAVKKEIDALEKGDYTLGDVTNMVYLGTSVIAGRGVALVVATGRETEMGQIAELLQTAPDEKTPLQIQLKRVGKKLAFLCLGISLVVILTGIIRGREIAQMLLAGVALAVAAIPEGLPAVVTVALALGVQSMARKNAIVRRLHAVETLGATSVICTDKTGTLTQNQMTVKLAYWDRQLQSLHPAYPKGKAPLPLIQLLIMATLCNDARSGDKGILLGDPTETALLAAAERFDLHKKELDEQNPRQAEIPFDSHRKRMTTINKVNNSWLIEDGLPPSSPLFLTITKGAPEIILEHCSHYIDKEGRALKITAQEKEHLLTVNSDMAGKAYRTIAIAYRKLKEIPAQIEPEEIEANLIFAGFIAMTDPLRNEVYGAIDLCKKAKINVVMVTGDHRRTAEAVAKELELLGKNDQVMTGSELEQIEDEELAKKVDKIKIYARVAPLQKVKIVNAFKTRNQIVAMTGDGINDAPALKRADIGVAMGVLGTDITKEASEMILADDNFATIVSAVKEGRLVFDNIKKFVLFLLSCNISEVFIMFLAIAIGLPLPLLPIQILWVNFVTDGLPALAIGTDPPEADLMTRPPRKPQEEILAPRRQAQVFWQGTFITIGALISFAIALFWFRVPESHARTVVFTTMVLTQLLHAFNFRSRTESLFSYASLENRFLVLAFLASLFLQLNVIYFAPLQPLFHTVSLGLAEWVLILASSLTPIIVINWIKLFLAKRSLFS